MHLKPLEIALLIATLLFIDIIIYLIDQRLGSGISVRPLFVIPIIISSIFLNIWSIAAFIIVTTLMHVESYRQSDFGSDALFYYAPNIFSNSLNYTIVAAAVIIGSKYRERLIINRDMEINEKIKRISTEYET